MAEVTLQLSKDGKYRTIAELEQSGGVTLSYQRWQMFGPWRTLNIVYLDDEAWRTLKKIAKENGRGG